MAIFAKIYGVLIHLVAPHDLCTVNDDISYRTEVNKGKGGTDTWHNLTLACNECNKLKGNQTPKEAGMKLLVTPLKFNQTKTLKFATQLQQGKNYLRESIYKLTGILPSFTYGQFTSWQRKKFDISKTHINDAVVIAVTTYDSENKPEIPEMRCGEYHVKAMGTKARAIFTATHYSPKDYCYRDAEGKRKRINSLEAGVNFGHTVRALKEINKACVLINGKAKAIKIIENIPREVTLIIEKGDVVKGKVKDREIKGRVSACMSNGTIRVLDNKTNAQTTVSMKKTKLVSKKENIVFQNIKHLTNKNK